LLQAQRQVVFGSGKDAGFGDAVSRRKTPSSFAASSLNAAPA
jgi:hypothetical protein